VLAGILSALLKAQGVRDIANPSKATTHAAPKARAYDSLLYNAFIVPLWQLVSLLLSPASRDPRKSSSVVDYIKPAGQRTAMSRPVLNHMSVAAQYRPCHRGCAVC
jgi:hypothetical protein